MNCSTADGFPLKVRGEGSEGEVRRQHAGSRKGEGERRGKRREEVNVGCEARDVTGKRIGTGRTSIVQRSFFFFFFSLSFLFSLLPDFYLVRSGSLEPVAIPSPTIV